MSTIKRTQRMTAMLLVLVMVFSMLPMHVHAAEVDATLTASLEKAKNYINGITINNSSNDPATVVKNFKTHFTWDNEKRENSKSYLFDWSYYNGVVFEGIEYVYEVTGETVYKDYVIEYMSSMITSSGGWATCSNNSSKQAAGYNSTHGADCYKTASLLLDSYEMTGDSRYLTMAATLYADLDSAAKSYSLSKAGNNYRHTWATDPTPDLWLDGLYMILPFRAEYAKYIGDTEELDLIVERMQWVSDNMYNSSKGLFYHAADSASSNSGTYWLRSIGWYAAAIVDIMDSMEGSNLEAMKVQLKKLVDGMKACQNSSNGMWLNNMNASQSSSNPYETSGTALTCYAVMKAVNNGWLDESYADMAILAFNGICNEKLSGSTLKDICFKGAPGSSNSTFYDNEGKGVGPFIMFYAEMLEYVNKAEEEPEVTEPEITEPEVTEPEITEPEVTEPEVTEPEVTEPEVTEPEVTEPEVTEPEEDENVYEGTGNLEADYVYTLDSDGINSGEKYLIVYSSRALQNNNGVDNNPTVSISNNTITLSDDSALAWTITLSSGSNYYVENNGSYINLSSSGTDPIGSSKTVYITGSGTYKFRNSSGSGAYLRYSNSQQWCAGTSSSNNSMYLYRNTGSGTGAEVVFSITPVSSAIAPGESVALNGTVMVDGKAVALSSCTITWASSNEAYATVSGGTVTGVAGGDANITATLSAVNGTALKDAIVLTIPVTIQGHDYTAVVTAPTCTEGGYTTYTCGNCGDSYVADYTDALGHDYDVVTVEPTCTENGSITYTCACGDSYVEVIEAIGHDYTAVVTAPTCTEGGYTTYTCGNCGDSYIADQTDALGHDYETLTVEPTCTENGSITYTCACGDSYVEVIEAIGHDYTAVVTAPTCIEGGYTTYTCGNCGDSYVADYTDALGHDYETVTVEATCTENGSITYTCACGDSYVEVIEATGHDYTAVVTAPTCIEGGYTTYTCGNCGDSYVADYTDALGHDNVSVVTEPTCETEGYTTHTCSVCGAVSVDSYVAALGHDYETVTVEATCTEDGSITYTCACGDSYVEVIEAIGHDYTAVVTAPTCTEGGYTTYTCGNCGDSYIADQTDALGHDYETLTVEPTCTENGSITYTCACGDSYVEVIEATGHDYTAVVTAPTCIEGGYTTYTCNVCGDSYVADHTDALGHDYETVTVEPTCTEGGYTTYTCTICQDGYVYDETEALGHDYMSVIVEATCTEGGYTTHTCNACGDSYVDAHVDALGHDYVSVVTGPTCETEGYTTHTCSACGAVSVDSYVAALGHDYETVTVEATCTEAGSITYTCACGESYVEVIEATGHNYAAVITAPTCTEGGYTTYTCNVCGDSYVEVIEAIGHDYTAVVTAPTCTEGGYTTYTCGNCGDSYVADYTDALGHDYETLTVEPTCTENGSITYTCACGDSYVEVIEAIGHDYTAVVTAPTCTEGGYTTYTCGNCGDSYVADQTDALGHDNVSVVTEPTCETEGYTTHTCSVCGAVSVDSYVAALGHDYETVTVEATCTEDGSITYTCACGDSYVEVIEATGHSYTSVEADGYLVYTCEHCGDTYSESIGWIALPNAYVLDTDGIEIGEDHKYIVVGVNQNYALTLSGSTIDAAAVSVDGDTITLENASAYEFYFVENSSKESGSYLLTQDGTNGVYHMGGNMYYGNDNKGYWHFGSSSNGSYQLYDYDNLNWYLNYGYVWSSDSVSRFAVSSNARYVRLFKSTEGYARLTGEMKQTCTDADGATESTVLQKVSVQTSTDGSNISETIAVTSDLVVWDTAFDGTTAGTYTGTVTYNGVVIGTITVTVTSEHAYETIVVAPTCTEQGYTVRTCTECGVSYTNNYTDALGHSYSCVESDGYLVYTCEHCGDSYSEEIEIEHTYTRVSTISSGNNYVITLYSGRKYYALSHANNQVSVVQVTVSNGEITSEITEDLLWTYSGSKLSYVANGTTYYMYCYTNNWWGGWWGNNGTTLSLSSSNSSTVSFSSNKLKVGSYYLRYSGGSVSLNSSATTTYFFVEE